MLSATYDRKADPRLKEAGKRGAARRWGPAGTQVVKIGDLTAEQRHLVIALVDAARSQQAGDISTKRTADVPTSTAQEAKRASATTPTL